MTEPADQHPGIRRYPLDATLSALPRNHHNEPVAPTTPDRRPYAMCWTDTDAHELVFAETADDLLAYWSPGYRDTTPGEQARMIANHAVTTRAALAAELVVDAQHHNVTISPIEQAILLADLDQLPDLDTWSSPVPLVLLEGMYRPYTDRVPPISGIDGDVQNPCNIIWLRNSNATAYVTSLAAAGVIQLDVHTDADA